MYGYNTDHQFSRFYLAVTNDESVGPAVAVVTDDIGKHPTG